MIKNLKRKKTYTKFKKRASPGFELAPSESPKTQTRSLSESCDKFINHARAGAFGASLCWGIILDAKVNDNNGNNNNNDNRNK